MGLYNFEGIGSAEVNKKIVKCNFSISADEFFNRFGAYEEFLSSKSKSAIVDSINSGKEEKIKKQDEIDYFFQQVQKQLDVSEAAMMVEEDTTSDETYAETSTYEEEKEEPVASDSYREQPSSVQSEAATDENDADGERIPIEIVEKIEAKYPYNYLAEKELSEDEEEESEKEELDEGYGILTRDGKFTVKNTSSDNRIWDITGKIINNGAIEEIDEKLRIRELGPQEENVIEYSLSAEKEPAVKVSEFISTINDPEKLTYSLNINQENIVYFKLSVKNTEDYPLKNIIVQKVLFDGYSDLQVMNTTSGEWSSEDGKLLWQIPEMDIKSEQIIEFTLSVSIDDKDQKISSGNVMVEYEAESSLSDLKVEEFEAFGDNKVAVWDEQQEDNPDVYRGYMAYENLTPYIAKLQSASVKEFEKDEELLTMPEEATYLSANATWKSNEWEIDTQGDIPEYQKQVQFILLNSLASIVSTSIEIEDIELAVAMFNAGISYDLEVIESRREVPFNATHNLTNGGAAPFDYLSIKHIIPEKFNPPQKEDIKLSIDGTEYALEPEWIKITPDDQESSPEHELFVEIEDMRLKEMGMFQPNSAIELVYPLIADNLDKEDELVTNVEWTVNTYPRGEPIVITESGEEALKIEVIHKRLKILRSKSVLATSDENIYEVVLQIRNNGTFDIENYLFKDRVPNKFNAESFSLDPTEHSDMDGKEVVEWNIENVPAGETVEIRYKIVPESEDANAAGAQFSM